MLLQRAITAFLLAVAFIAAIFLLPNVVWAGLSIFLVALSAWEWARLSGIRTQVQQLAFAAAVACAVYGIIQINGSKAHIYWTANFFWLIAAPFLLWRGQMPRQTALLLPAGAIVLVAAGVSLIEMHLDSPLRLLLVLCVVWVSDTAAYFSGRAFGNRKLAPSISPGKTWEGIGGAITAVGTYALLVAWFGLESMLPRWLGSGSVVWISFLWLVFCALGVIGDLIESMLKRSAGVKDSGSLLPGHGGVLDRVDALLPVLPIAATIYLS